MSAKWRQFFFGLNVLRDIENVPYIQSTLQIHEFFKDLVGHFEWQHLLDEMLYETTDSLIKFIEKNNDSVLRQDVQKNGRFEQFMLSFRKQPEYSCANMHLCVKSTPHICLDRRDYICYIMKMAFSTTNFRLLRWSIYVYDIEKCMYIYSVSNIMLRIWYCKLKYGGIESNLTTTDTDF